MKNYRNAIKKWEALLGSDYCLQGYALLKEMNQATLKNKSKIVAVLKPKNTAEVRSCLKIACQFHIPLYPISRGYNWGFGSRLPVNKETVVLSLERMDKIIDFNEALSCITVEPGVTFELVFEFLRKRHSSLFLSVPGTTPKASLIGNLLERGFSFGLGGYHFDEVFDFEVILPNGNIIHTSNRRYHPTHASSLGCPSPGPLLEGLFSQSNLGVVTKVTFRLRKIPDQLCYVGFQIRDQRNFRKMIPIIRELIKENVITPLFYLINDYQILNTVLDHYPFEMMSYKTPLSNSVKNRLKKIHNIGEWQGGFLIYAAGRKEAQEKFSIIARKIRLFVDTFFEIKASQKKCLKILEAAYQKKLPESSLYKFLAISLGFPEEAGLKFAYWRKKTIPKKNLNPDRDGCGVIWLPIITPLETQAILRAQAIINQVMTQYKLEPKITLKFLSPQHACLNIGIIYDREISSEDENALKCYRALFKKFSALGYYPYRLTIQSMYLMKSSMDDTADLIKLLKNAIDPLHILAPGRYDGLY